MRFPRFFPLFIVFALSTFSLFAQSPDGNINGLVSDPSSAAVVGAEVIAVNDVTGVQYTTKTNTEGIYVLPNLPPGPYRLQLSKIGFKTIIKPDIILNVQDALSLNFTLPVGAFHEIVTVEGGASSVNTESAAVSTVVDRQFADNLPMNGRSFQTLIDLTPGVVVTPSNPNDGGQFSVNGQRASSNYWMVDGVSANIGIGTSSVLGNGFGGSLGSFSVSGGTNSLVSVDALQEFRIQTSTYAPEFGRTPGAQISIVTRSGTNQFHGTLFDYLRNDLFDANDWFADNMRLPKPEERQNDFGGTLSGPLLKNRTFFFFSYEGLRLRLPQIGVTTVPDLSARQDAGLALQPYLNAFPMPNGSDNVATGIASFNQSFSSRSTLDAASVRIDHHLNAALALFGRYNYSPSELAQPGAGNAPLSDVNTNQIATQTTTLGGTWEISPLIVNDLRFNYSRTGASSYYNLDTLGGAVPLTALPFPSSYTAENGLFFFDIFSLTDSNMFVGKNTRNLQRQINLVDNLAVQKGTHTLKFGIDFRRLSPLSNPQQYQQFAYFSDVPSAETGSLDFSLLGSLTRTTLLFRNLGVFAQDTWRITPRVTLTYGLRWDIDVAPSSLEGPNIPAVTGFNLNDLSQLALAIPGRPPFRTRYSNLAPRIGLAYELSPRRAWQTVLRGGFGVFYDLASSEIGNLLNGGYPYYANAFNFGGTFPLAPAAAIPPPITSAGLKNFTFYAIDPNLELPYTLQWNLAMQQALGKEQTLSASYIGAVGRRLLQTEFTNSPNANFGYVNVVGNVASSNYNALQLQFERRLSDGLQALASYTWSHSIDDASAGSVGATGNAFVPGSAAGANRGSSDFDIRNAISAGVTYDLPTLRNGSVVGPVLRGWSVQTVVQVRSAPPVDLWNSQFEYLSNGALTNVRPNVVPGQPYYLHGSLYAGRKALNPAAFTNPPIDPNTGLPLLEGDLGRNTLRGFGASQWDFAVHRDFPIHERLKLQFRAELFNILNHPNFGQPVTDLSNPQFGRSIQMLGQSLNNGNLGGGALDPLYQIGGPRSVQLALKLMF